MHQPRPPGAASVDTIVFDATVFPTGFGVTVELGDTLPTLHTGDDTVDGSAAEVIVQGDYTETFDCFEIRSNQNTIKGLPIVGCRIGVLIHDGAQNNTIGGSTQAERNIISWNDVGVVISGAGTAGNIVRGNFIGTDAAGTSSLGNRIGVTIDYGAQNNTVEGNVISGNGQGGVAIQFGAQGNTVQGNLIGTSAAGDAPVPNGGGVAILNSAQNNTIGGTAAGEGNVIAFNNEHGVRVRNADTAGNTIRGNSIHSNGGKGIELVDGGNTQLEAPTIIGFGSLTGTACANCTIDVYSDQEDEGEVYEGFTNADGDGDWTFPGSPEGPKVTATATDSDGNTSEFSDPVAVPEATPSPTATATASPTATSTPVPSNGHTRTLD